MTDKLEIPISLPSDDVVRSADRMEKAIKKLERAEKDAVTDAERLERSTKAAGNAVEAAGRKAARAADGFDKATRAMNRQREANGRFLSSSARRAAEVAATTGADTALFHGPVLDRNAQSKAWSAQARNLDAATRLERAQARMNKMSNAAARKGSFDGDWQGPVLNRKAQGFGLMQRARFGFEDSVRDLTKWNSAAGESIERWQALTTKFMSTPFGFVIRGLGSIGSAIYDIGAFALDAVWQVTKLGGSLAAIAAVMLTKKVDEMAAFEEGSRQAFGRLAGSKGEGDKWWDTSIGNAMDLGKDVEKTVDAFKSLRAAQFDLGKANELYRMGQDLVTVTGHADAAERAIYAITKIKATGRLQGDELMMLAEAGVSLDMVYGKLEKSLKTNRAGVLRKQTAGQIDQAVAIDAIQSAIADKTHSKKAGDAAQEYSRTTLAGSFERVMNMPSLLALRISKSIDKGPLKDSLTKISDAMMGVEDGPLARFVDTMNRGLATAVDFTVGFANGVVTNIDRISQALSFGKGDVTAFGEEAGASVVDFFERVINVTKKVGPVIVDAVGAFLDGMDVDQLMNDVAQADFKQLGADLVTIARALGDITNATAKVVGFVGKGISNPIGDPISDVTAGLNMPGLGTLVGFVSNLFGDDAKPDAAKPLSKVLPASLGGGGSSVAGGVSGAMSQPVLGEIRTTVVIDDKSTKVKQQVIRERGAKLNPSAGPVMLPGGGGS